MVGQDTLVGVSVALVGGLSPPPPNPGPLLSMCCLWPLLKCYVALLWLQVNTTSGQLRNGRPLRLNEEDVVVPFYGVRRSGG